MATRAPGFSRAANPDCGELLADFGGDIGNPAIREVLANDEQAGKWHDVEYFNAGQGRFEPGSHLLRGPVRFQDS